MLSLTSEESQHTTEGGKTSTRPDDLSGSGMAREQSQHHHQEGDQTFFPRRVQLEEKKLTLTALGGVRGAEGERLRSENQIW